MARADVIAEQRDLAQARAALPDLRRDLERMRHRLAVYAGLSPGAADLPEFRMAELQLPAELPLSLPSQLARQRPDVRAAEAVLARAGAQVGVATASLYPQITLSAQVGTLLRRAAAGPRRRLVARESTGFLSEPRVVAPRRSRTARGR